jgi:hypothetical protein
MYMAAGERKRMTFVENKDVYYDSSAAKFRGSK